MSNKKTTSKRRRTKRTKEEEIVKPKTTGELFSEADLKSIEMSEDPTMFTVPPNNPNRSQITFPVGVYGVDESLVRPQPTKPSNNESATENLPPINPDTQNHSNRNISRHYPMMSQHNPLAQLSHPYPSFFGDISSYEYDGHRHRRHRHHHHHHHHHHHRHRKALETFDPRWWYLFPKSVHTPSTHRQPEEHFVPRKWYESTSGSIQFFSASENWQTKTQPIIDCRCEVCRPSRKPPRGFRWVVNDQHWI